MLDSLQRIPTYKTLHALCSTGTRGKLRAHFYVCCLAGGRVQLWGCWNINGRFLHFAPSRDAIGDLHPNLTWRRVMARWQLADDHNWKPAERRLALSDELRTKLPERDGAWNPEMAVLQ